MRSCVLRRWGESDVDEVVEHMERIYAAALGRRGEGKDDNAEGAAAAGGRGASGVVREAFTWEGCMANITGAIGAGGWRRRRLGP